MPEGGYQPPPRGIVDCKVARTFLSVQKERLNYDTDKNIYATLPDNKHPCLSTIQYRVFLI